MPNYWVVGASMDDVKLDREFVEQGVWVLVSRRNGCHLNSFRGSVPPASFWGFFMRSGP